MSPELAENLNIEKFRMTVIDMLVKINTRVTQISNYINMMSAEDIQNMRVEGEDNAQQATTVKETSNIQKSSQVLGGGNEQF